MNPADELMAAMHGYINWLTGSPVNDQTLLGDALRDPNPYDHYNPAVMFVMGMQGWMRNRRWFLAVGRWPANWYQGTIPQLTQALLPPGQPL